MQRLQIQRAGVLTDALSNALRGSAEARFVHRLHCVVLVAGGLSCYAVADLFGDHPRTIERWVRQFQTAGIDGLAERPHAGRPATLLAEQMLCLADLLHRESGTAWDGTALQSEILRRFAVSLSRRQCRRLLCVLLAGTNAHAALPPATGTPRASHDDPPERSL